MLIQDLNKARSRHTGKLWEGSGSSEGMGARDDSGDRPSLQPLSTFFRLRVMPVVFGLPSPGSLPLLEKF